MEYVNGEDLRVACRGAPPSSARPLAPADVATILVAAVARRCTTRTNAASCIATSRRRTCSSRYDGVVKLADFGIAKSQATSPAPRRTPAR